MHIKKIIASASNVHRRHQMGLKAYQKSVNNKDSISGRPPSASDVAAATQPVCSLVNTNALEWKVETLDMTLSVVYFRGLTANMSPVWIEGGQLYSRQHAWRKHGFGNTAGNNSRGWGAPN